MRRRVWILAAIACCGVAQSPTPTRAAKSPSIAAVLARAKLAQGGERWDRLRSLRTIGQLRTATLQGPFESLDDAQTGRHHDRYDLGAVRGENGFDGAQAWTIDPAGTARLETGAAARAAAFNEAWRRSHSFWSGKRPGRMQDLGPRDDAGRKLRVIRVLPVGGRPFELWVDPASGLFDRIVERNGADILTTWLADYRQVDGMMLPFALRVANGDPKYDQLYIIERIDVDVAIEASDFAVPAGAR